MGNNSFRLDETEQFQRETKLLFADNRSPLQGLFWALQRNPFFGQQVKGSDRRVGVLYYGGSAYLVYYVVRDDSVLLESILKRKVPIAPGPLGLEP